MGIGRIGSAGQRSNVDDKNKLGFLAPPLLVGPPGERTVAIVGRFSMECDYLGPFWFSVSAFKWGFFHFVFCRGGIRPEGLGY